MSVARRVPSRPSATSATSSAKISSATAASSGDRGGVTKRLRTELMTLMTSNTVGISAFPDGDDLFQWSANINGVEGTPYEGMEFKLAMKFSSNYPYEAPTVTFVTPIFHPNIDTSGNICLDILKDKWSALLDVRSILLSIQSLLGEPNNESPLNGQAASLWIHTEEFRRVALKKYTDAVAAAAK